MSVSVGTPGWHNAVRGGAVNRRWQESGHPQAAAAGQLARGVSPEHAAYALHALIDGLVANWTLDKTSFALVETGTEIIDSYLAGLRTVGRG